MTIVRTIILFMSPDFQDRVNAWFRACFNSAPKDDKVERYHRFLEEALELVQSFGCNQADAHQLVEYVYGRPKGESSQEVGGTLTTLAALCEANNLDMNSCGEAELKRVWTKILEIRAKQAAKPPHSPLP